jgi:TPR repeat protein
MRIVLYFFMLLVSLSSCAPVTTPAHKERLARAEKGEAFAQFEIGSDYLAGKDVPRDHVAARYWFRKAADQGFLPAQMLLGMMFYVGLGGPPDHAEAAIWYRKAAEQGNGLSQYWLGRIYAEGRGVPQDPVRAHIWLSLALAGDLPDNAKKEAPVMIAKLSQTMTPQQLQQAQAMAEACLAARFQNCD